ncbi:MAG: metallophosphoesterase [Eubacteriales bacterium]|nr:metallophosphoesterase [Eubacteriales bacterium]
MDDTNQSNKQLSNRKKHIRTIIIIILILFSVWVYWGNVSIKTTQIQIFDAHLPDNFKGFVIAQVSDLHNVEFGDNQRRLLNALEKSNPDIIVVTGDLIDSSHTNISIAMDFIDSAVNIAPVFYITGNHEAWSDQSDLLHERLLKAGVILLRDESQKIEKGGQFINLIGIDDPDFTMHGEDEYAVSDMTSQKLNSLNDQTEGYKILLSHRPEMFETYCDAGLDLVLSGHAHGGQFRIPCIGGLVAPNQGSFPKYTAGCYKKGDTKMIVSRGLGNSIIPVRVNNRPELVVAILMR